MHAAYEIPRVPASAGALIFDEAGDLLVLKPTYKAGWTIPGGQMEAGGESPWEACQREVLEETGIVVKAGNLVCIDFLTPKGARRPGGVRFLFDCGVLDRPTAERIVVQPEEIERHRFVEPGRAVRTLSRPLGRRVGIALASSSFVYLENGRPVLGVGSIESRRPGAARGSR
jgi:8-oxo-dGTP pyrophosphatase MutT (NUDIX family)